MYGGMMPQQQMQVPQQQQHQQQQGMGMYGNPAARPGMGMGMGGAMPFGGGGYNMMGAAAGMHGASGAPAGRVVLIR